MQNYKKLYNYDIIINEHVLNPVQIKSIPQILQSNIEK